MIKNIYNGINDLDDHLANSKKAQKNVTLHLDYKESDGMFLRIRVIDADRTRIGFNVDGSNGRREAVEKVAQGGSNGETIPDCIYDLCKTMERACRGEESAKKLGKTMNLKRRCERKAEHCW